MQSPFTIFSFALLTKKKEKPQFMASGLANNNNNNNKTRTKETQTNKFTIIPIYEVSVFGLVRIVRLQLKHFG